ncbi:hypothetical protein FA13DRAFT_1107842 [Coprinellus micaceus]|uniref:Uncharacterized protein n=1 Tax=Coprinellus micaceus TaxID=71717 RepID=A0A4Y7RK67_COPMI|nr:hypothetical protein FA13DRAFT_1107842 [Coprinellus micaceus]
MFLGLPSELIHDVLANLAGNAKALTSRCLICKGLYLPGQTCLFSRVELHLHIAAANADPPHRKDGFSREAKLLKDLSRETRIHPLGPRRSIYDLFGGEELLVAETELTSGMAQDLIRKNDSALVVLSMLASARRLMIFGYNTRSWEHLNPNCDLQSLPISPGS